MKGDKGVKNLFKVINRLSSSELVNQLHTARLCTASFNWESVNSLLILISLNNLVVIRKQKKGARVTSTLLLKCSKICCLFSLCFVYYFGGYDQKIRILTKSADSVIESTCPSVCLCVCLFVTFQNILFWRSWRPLVEGCIANVGLR